MSSLTVNANVVILPVVVHDGGVAESKQTKEEVMVQVAECFNRALQNSQLEVKRSAYNEAFLIIKASYCQELRPLLMRLFERYAMETCYAQESEERGEGGKSVDDELGFRKCARLMELTFCMQMHDLGFLGSDFDWAKHPTLDTIIEDLQIGPTQKGLLFDVIGQL